ncbi:hypothetical protein CKO12_06970 [Chromatium okenii]|uniref:glycosyltransferase n=1 Tax=Chromatium okenii TaxID=61644 RepID=UPI0019082C04|nr:glycosyltransferase [Chromatium okenii]MBK1641619.1 hypothetical protein [Chromatium okenii]
MSHHYHRHFNPAANDSLAQLARFIHFGSEVLDLGAGPGVLATYLATECGCAVDGIELNPTAAQVGQLAFRSLWIADLNHTDPATLVGAARYDAIICADILEHLIAPATLLNRLGDLLKPEGQLLLSVPNIAHAGLLAELLNGEWRYRQEGLLDDTHLRFFTRNSLTQLLNECGWKICNWERVIVPIEDSEFSPLLLDNLAAPVRDYLLSNADADTYQFIVACQLATSQSQITATTDKLNAANLPIDVIIPVYADVALTQRCIESVLSAPVTTPFELIVIDDASPEPALREWLSQRADHKHFTLLENEENSGYVVSVNRGMALHPDRDVVLLNSDTEVANDWLDRLRAAAYQAPDVGTVTPFANSGATICSYPLFCQDNPLPEGWTVAALDALLATVNAGTGVDLPTSVGYCTYIRRACLAQVGLFDAVAFGHGYGEENDFSLRAHYRGWRHRLASDVFVQHHGGVSFGTTKAERIAQAQITVRERHPAYDLMVATHIRHNPARALRNCVSWQRLAQSPLPRLLFISHDLGGGVDRHIRELAQWLESKAEVLVLRPDGDDGLTLNWQRRSEDASLNFQRQQDFPRLRSLLRALRISRVHIQHLLGIADVAQQILDALNVPYDLTVHDFFPICPRINLMHSAGHFCAQPPEVECNRCLAMDRLARSRDIAAWRTEQERWLRGAARVLVPSHDTAARLQQVWSTLEVQIAGHDQFNSSTEFNYFTVNKREFNKPLRIIVLGQLSIAKGLNVLVECAQDAAQRQLPLEFHLLGEPLQPVPSSAEIPLFIHGAYLETELAARLHFLAPHLAWFPAQWPETWSYTLSACLAADLPVVAPNLGAFPERLATRVDATLLPLGLSAAAINERLLQIVSPRQPDADAPTANLQLKNNNFFYQTDYLMPRNATPTPTPRWEPGAPLLAADLLIDRSERPRPFALWQSSDQPLADQLVRLRDANVALHGGLAERDAVISQQLNDADRAWCELANHRDQMHTLLVHHRAELNDVIAQSHVKREELLAQHRAELNDVIVQSHVKREELLAHLSNLNAQFHIKHEELLAQHHSERTELKNEIAQIYRSWSWQFTRPLRGLGRALRMARSNLVTRLQFIWQRLPVPPTARYQLKSIAFRSAAPLFRGTAAYSAWLEQTRWAQAPQFTSSLPTHNTPVVKNLRIAGGVAAAPLVSIIIPVFNKLDYTLACLDSIAEQLPQVAIEVLVIDDHSNDDTERELSARDDIRYLRNATNLGFVGSCNRGAAEARGAFLFFLNNDTVVLSGWLDTLVQTFIDYPQAGLVGSKLIYPDGRLQEAGGIIWADASGWNWGRLANPNAPEFNFLRAVDYCSGAALLIRTTLFNEIGGFDMRYAPAYYEDTDLAFTVRAHGLQVFYQPLSQVIHYEGITAGTDLSSGMKAYQVRNRERFYTKWASVLLTHGDAASHSPRLSADRHIVGRLLVIDACTPTPDQDSGSLDMFNYLRLFLSFGYRVTFIPASDLLHFGRYTSALQALGVECLYHPYIHSVMDVLRERGTEFAAVMLTRVTVASDLIAHVKTYCPQAKILFNTVDLHFLREQRLIELSGDHTALPHVLQLRTQELAVMRQADTTIVISPVEQALLAEIAPEVRVRVIPILREIPGRSADFVPRSGLIFVGGFRHPPNIDAMQWFCAEIWPLLRRERPTLELFIVGSHLVPEVAALAGNGVQVLGFVEDIAPIFARVRLSIAPLRYGAGQKGKVVTSLGYGVPAVLTPVAAEGLGLGADEGALVAEKPADFAAAVMRLHEDETLWQRLSAGGLARVEREFSVAANRDRLATLMIELGLKVI